MNNYDLNHKKYYSFKCEKCKCEINTTDKNLISSVCCDCAKLKKEFKKCYCEGLREKGNDVACFLCGKGSGVIENE